MITCVSGWTQIVVGAPELLKEMGYGGHDEKLMERKQTKEEEVV